MLLINFVSFADFKVALCKSRIFPIKAILKHKQVACYPGCQRVYFFGSEAAIVRGIIARNRSFATEKKNPLAPRVVACMRTLNFIYTW